MQMTARLGGIAVMLAAAGAISAGEGSDASAARQALLDADVSFAADVANGGADAWAAWFARDGIQLPSHGLVEGREAIAAHMRPLFESGGRLDWRPTTAVAAASGELGYTLGAWTLSDGDGNVVGTGRYVTIWTLTAEEGWRVAVDIGNTDAPR